MTADEVYAILKKKIGSEGGTITPEQIQQAVDDYLSKNPVSGVSISVEDHILKFD